MRMHNNRSTLGAMSPRTREADRDLVVLLDQGLAQRLRRRRSHERHTLQLRSPGGRVRTTEYETILMPSDETANDRADRKRNNRNRALLSSGGTATSDWQSSKSCCPTTRGSRRA